MGGQIKVIGGTILIGIFLLVCAPSLLRIAAVMFFFVLLKATVFLDKYFHEGLAVFFVKVTL